MGKPGRGRARQDKASRDKTSRKWSNSSFKERAATGGSHHAPAADALRWGLSPVLSLFLFLFLVMLPAAADKTWGDPSNDGIGDGGSKSASRSCGGSVAAEADGADARTCFVIRSEAQRTLTVTLATAGGLLPTGRKGEMGVEAGQARVRATSSDRPCIRPVSMRVLKDGATVYLAILRNLLVINCLKVISIGLRDNNLAERVLPTSLGKAMKV
ncbi:hypothetical protein CHU98_g6069 [Xylaria longipes]|nr:hypothetical protein CHU98_g6069 [Xylaria longipes]